MMNASTTMLTFDELCSQGKYEEAADLMSENVYFANPKITCLNKAEWLIKFPAFVKKFSSSTLCWDEVKPKAGVSIDGESNIFEYQRTGHTRFLGFSVRLEEDLVFDDQGKITFVKVKRG